MRESLMRCVLAPFVELRYGESTTAVLMFAYSFLAMTAYNILKPITRSKFIAESSALQFVSVLTPSRLQAFSLVGDLA